MNSSDLPDLEELKDTDIVTVVRYESGDIEVFSLLDDEEALALLMHGQYTLLHNYEAEDDTPEES